MARRAQEKNLLRARPMISARGTQGLSYGSIALPFQRDYLRVSYLDTRREHSPVPLPNGLADSNSPTTVLTFLTKLATFRLSSSLSCCEFCRNVSLNV